MKLLHVLYDRDCALCRSSRRWLDGQPALVPLRFISFQEALFDPVYAPLAALRPEREIIVVADTGEVWQGGAAWVVCLWALKEYRPLANRLASPGLLPLARRLVSLVSRNRRRLSGWLGPVDACHCAPQPRNGNPGLR